MAIILQQPPSGLELIGNALAGIIQKKQEQAQQLKNLESMSAVYDKFYNNTPQTAAAPDFSRFDMFNPASMQASVSQYRTGYEPSQNPLTQSANQLNTQTSTPGRNPYAKVLEVLKNNPGISPTAVLPMAMQWDQEQRTQAQKTIDQQQYRNALARLSQAQGRPGTEMALAALQFQGDTGKNIDNSILGMMTPKWKTDFAPNGTLIQVDERGNVRDGRNYAKPEKPESPYGASGGTIYNKQNGQVIYTKPAADKTSSQSIQQYRADNAAHNQWVKANAMKIMSGELSPEDSPYWPRIMAHLDGGQQQSNNQSGMSPKMQDFVSALNNHVQTHGADSARQWVNQQRDFLMANEIDPDIALTWIK